MTGFRQAFRKGDAVSLILEDMRLVGQGKIARILANGEAYAVEFKNILFVVEGRAAIEPDALKIGKSLYLWLLAQKLAAPVTTTYLKGASSVTH